MAVPSQLFSCAERGKPADFQAEDADAGQEQGQEVRRHPLETTLLHTARTPSAPTSLKNRHYLPFGDNDFASRGRVKLLHLSWRSSS